MRSALSWDVSRGLGVDEEARSTGGDDLLLLSEEEEELEERRILFEGGFDDDEEGFFVATVSRGRSDIGGGGGGCCLERPPILPILRGGIGVSGTVDSRSLVDDGCAVFFPPTIPIFLGCAIMVSFWLMSDAGGACFGRLRVLRLSSELSVVL